MVKKKTNEEIVAKEAVVKEAIIPQERQEAKIVLPDVEQYLKQEMQPSGYFKDKVIVRVIQGAGIRNFYTSEGLKISTDKLTQEFMLMPLSLYNSKQNADFRKVSVVVASCIKEYQ